MNQQLILLNHNNMEKFLFYILGTNDYAFLFANYFFAIVAIVISLLAGVLGRDKCSPHTPFEFSWKFFFSDNNIRMFLSFLLSFLVLFLTLRFTKELTGRDLSFPVSAGIGFGLDKLVQRWKDRKKDKDFNIDGIGGV